MLGTYNWAGMFVGSAKPCEAVVDEAAIFVADASSLSVAVIAMVAPSTDK